MSEPENDTTPATPAQPVFPPIDATKAVPPVTPFPAWTWNTPVIPQFYWNVYSSEQRIRQICVEIGRIQAYLEYFAANSNAAHWYLDNRFTQVETRLTARVDKLEKELGEEVARLGKALADETRNRVDGDKALQARIDATKTALTTGMNRRPLASAITAKEGSGVTVESKETDDGSGTGVVIGSTWEGDFTAMRNDLTAETAARTNADGALQAKLDAETGERRHDDAELGRRIDGKLAFGAVRAGDGITVVNDPDTTTATVSAEVTKAMLDEAIAGIPARELPTATAERLGGVKVGTGLTVTEDGTLNATGTGTGTGSGLETVSHDDTMEGDGTAGNPLKVRPAGIGRLGVVKPGKGLNADNGTMNVKLGNGLFFNTSNELELIPGNGLIFSGDTITVALGNGLNFNTDNQLEPKLGEGLSFSDNGAITATGAAGTSESVKVVYPTATQDALGAKNTSGRWSVGEFLNFFAGVDKNGLPEARFDVKYVELTKKQVLNGWNRTEFREDDFETVNGGYFNGCIALNANIAEALDKAAQVGYSIASIDVVSFGVPGERSLLLNPDSILTFFSSTDKAALTAKINSLDDSHVLYSLYCVMAHSDERLLDIYSRNN